METERIVLRKWALEDAADLVKNINDESMAYNLGTEYPYTYEDACNYITNAIKLNKEKYAIVDKNNHSLIGGCGIHLANKLASISLWISPKYRMQGIGTEALFLLIKHCYIDLKIEKVENVFFDGNEASKKMQEKIGAIIDETNESVQVNGKTRVKKKATICRKDFEKIVKNFSNINKYSL